MRMVLRIFRHQLQKLAFTILNSLKASHMRILKYHWPLFYVLFVTATLFVTLSNWSYDDPFITYRYARNFANGFGFVYNYGERVQSTTTPLFTILLAGISLFWDNIPKLANLIGALSLGLGAIFIWDLAQTWQTPVVGWISLLIYPSFPLLFTTISSETPLYLAFCLGTFAFYAKKDYSFTAILAALATLTRPDGVLVPVILGIHYLLFIKKPIPWKAIILFLVPTLVWFTFAWIYFGSPLPVTLAAKQHQESMAISQSFAQGFITTAKPYTNQWQYIYALVFAAFGLIFSVFQHRTWLLYLIWPVLYFIAYALLDVSRYFWYYAPLVPGFVVAFGLGINSAQKLWQRISIPYQTLDNWRSIQFVLLPLILVTPLLYSQVDVLINSWGRVDARYAIYRAIGEWLTANTPEDATIGVLEVGIIGYYAKRPMVDFAGLLQPLTSQQIDVDTTYIDLTKWAIEYYKPNYIVLHSNWIPEFENSYLTEKCQIIKYFNGSEYEFDLSLDIYACEPYNHSIHAPVYSTGVHQN